MTARVIRALASTASVAAGWRDWLERRAVPDDDNEAPERLQPVQWLPTSPWAFLWHFVRSYYLGRYVAMILAVVVAQGLETLEPYAVKRVVNSVTGGAASARSVAVAWFGILVFLWIASSLMVRVYQAIDIFAAPYLRERVQNQLFGYLLGHSPRYFQDNFAGRLGQKVKESARACLGIMELLTFDMTKIVMMLLVALALLAFQDSTLATGLGLWTLIYVAISSLLARRCVRLSKSMSDAVSTSSGKMIDAIANADAIRSFARWRFERRFLSRYFVTERQGSMRLRWFLLLMRVFQAIAVFSMLGLMTYAALDATLAKRLDIGTFTMVFTLTNLISLNIWNLSNRMLDFFDHTGTLTEAIDLVTQQHEIVDRPDAVPLVVDRGAISFQAVTYRHPDGATLFDHLDLDIAAGEKVALVGPSGSGKSTLVKLLRRQFEPQGGRVLIDGQDIAGVTWDSLNETIAEVPQAPAIFHRPIADNIRYGHLDAGEREILAASAQAHCHPFILQRPQGYRTIVGEQGIKLSGGERQRVAIARALLKDARILVLDEATSSLDSESEHLIQEALWELMPGRTVIAIAHRLSTITGMDRILYLEKGRILEQGTHADLLARGGPYAHLWSRQVGGFIGNE